MEDKPMKRWEAIALAVLIVGLLAVFYWPRESDFETIRVAHEYQAR